MFVTENELSTHIICATHLPCGFRLCSLFPRSAYDIRNTDLYFIGSLFIVTSDWNFSYNSWKFISSVLFLSTKCISETTVATT
jgi:hypothetical protein